MKTQMVRRNYVLQCYQTFPYLPLQLTNVGRSRFIIICAPHKIHIIHDKASLPLPDNNVLTPGT